MSSGIGRAYRQTPPKELKYRARDGDAIASMLYQVARHGASADAFAWAMASFFTASALILAAGAMPALVAVLFAFCLLLLVFVLIPIQRTGRLTRRAASKIAPWLAKLLRKVRPLSNTIEKFVLSRRPVVVHTGLYDKADLVELFERQRVAGGNRIEQNELDIVLHALEFGDKMVKDVMTPKRMIHFVGGDEPIGPILITELHNSGFSRFPVTGDNPDQIIGTLYLRDLVEFKKTGVVKNIMKSAAYYVNHDHPLEHVLSAFIKTKHHIFIAVNEFEEIVGLITIEDVIEQIIGHEIVDEFDQHEDLRAVAALEARKENKTPKV